MEPLDQAAFSTVTKKESVMDFECALCLALSSDNEAVRAAIESSNEKDEKHHD
jgi:hypothetical protein